MRAILFSLKSILFSFSLLLFSHLTRGQAQPNPVLIISPHVGEVIDLEEKTRFNLFPYVSDSAYMIGRFFQLPDKQIVLEVINKNGRAETRTFTKEEFELTGQLIEAKIAAAQPISPKPAPKTGKPDSPAASKTSLSGKLYYVILADGLKFFATISEKASNYYVFETQLYGSITAPFQNIRYLKEVENKKINGSYWIPNAHDSRLFFGPTGRGIPQGEGYVQTIYGYLNSANYGITDNFSIGTMFLLVPFVPLEYNIFSFTPKVSFKTSSKTSLAAGVLYASVFGESFGIVYGSGTYGNRNDHLTGGLGFGFFNDELSKTPVVMFGGVKRISNRLSLMSENYILSLKHDEGYGTERETNSFGLYGLRFIWPRTNLDLGAVYYYYSRSSDNDYDNEFISSYLVPIYFSFTFKLGNRLQVGKIR